MRISIDFETRSVANLKRVGVYRYAEDPTTDITCMAWAVEDQEPNLWKLGDQFPMALLMLEYEIEFRAWNAQFERVLWEQIGVLRYGWPAPRREQWVDTAAEAAAMALPRALGHCAEVLKVVEQKDRPGENFVLRMARPRSTKGGKIVWWTDPEKLERLYTYCKQDVRTERALMGALRRLGKREQRIYALDQRINERGVQIDVPLANAMRDISEIAVAKASQVIRETTKVVTGITKVIDLRAWLETRGIVVDGVSKPIVRDLLAGELPDDVRTVLTARQEAGRSSVAKIMTALGARCADDRIRGMLLYHGANTGRWAGRLVQVHNFPRGEIDYRPFLPLVFGGEYDLLNAITPPLTAVSAMLRGMLVPAEGSRFLVGDYSQIEARVLAWLAGQDGLVRAFERGEPIYEKMAAVIYQMAVADVGKDSFERYMGKQTVLGCGFGMGAEKFAARVYETDGVVVPPELAQQSVDEYRALFPKIPKLWYALDAAAHRAVANPGTTEVVRGVKFTRRGAYLWIILPSGRPLAYADPKIKPRKTPWGEVRDTVTAWSVNSQTRKWERRALYGGLLTENIVQALARDIMADAMLRMDADYPIVLTVHDEIVAEVENGRGTLEEFITLATQVEPWAKGCPVGFEAWEGDRYRK